MEAYWEAANGHAPHSLKYESEAGVPGYTYCGEPGLNFSANNTTYSEDDADFPPGRRGKTSRQDPLSHRIIEKRRRDRMNSCLADLSRLIPQQYMRKGRGRVEKTEIIEMAIRHLKNLQNQECGRETSCAEQYRLGYNECLTEAAKFMMRERGEDMCFRMVAHLKEHCNEIMKGELTKSRCGVELGNGGSPLYLAGGQLGHLREILTCPSDLEHSSNDHHDVKDLSFRSATSTSSSTHSNNPPQAAVITSTAPSIVQHLDTSSNHSTQDYDAPSPPARVCSGSGVGGLQQDTNNNINQHESVLRTIRMRKFSEHASPEHEHSHNSYKFKNYIQQRFSQDTHENGHSNDYDRSPVSLHDEHHLHQHPHSLGGSPLTNGSSGSVSGADSKSSSTSTLTGKSSTVASSSDEPLSLKRKLPSSAASNGEESPASGGSPMENGTHHHAHHHHQIQQQQQQQQQSQQQGTECAPMEKKQALGKGTMVASSTVTPVPASEIKHELLGTNGVGAGAGTVVGLGTAHHHHHQQSQPLHLHHHSSYHPVPIFACHTQGFYIPLNVEYESLLPYLNGIDLLSKSFLQMPPLHPISISVNYSPATMAGAGGNGLLIKASTVNGVHPPTKPKLVEGIMNGC